MAQSQQQYPMPPRPFSPPQSTSSATSQQFALPPNKRQRLSPNPPSQPSSPYVQSPYAMPPNSSVAVSTGASPYFANVQLPNVYNTPYSNGHTSSGLSLTLPQSNHQHSSNPNSLSFTNQGQPNQQPNFNNYAMPAPQSHGHDGSALEAGREAQEDGIDVMDVLGGTGIDLREEEQYTFQMYNTSFNSQLSGSQSGTISSGHSFTQFPPGDEASFYGAGPANAAAERPIAKSQDEYMKKAADKAWHDAAHDLAVSRQKELNNPFLQVHLLHRKMDKITREHGLTMNVDPKGQMGHMKLPQQFPREVRVSTVLGADSGFVTTSGQFVPIDSMLVDQVALLSIATKHRLRGLLEDATKLAKGRQTTSHGVIPKEWEDVAAPIGSAISKIGAGGQQSGWESAVSPRANSLKRSFSSAIKTPDSAINSKITNEVVAALRADATKERDMEERRLAKRNDPTGAKRQGSVAPGTPGSIAPESTEKAPTKKEQKKKAEAKVNEAANHAAANTTTAQFLFGRKKKYSWMDQSTGGSASGTSTPGRINTQDLPGTPAGVNAPPQRLTQDGVRRLGTWREDKEKGRNIQMRDWISVLETDGREKKTLQKAYLFLDQSDPK